MSGRTFLDIDEYGMILFGMINKYSTIDDIVESIAELEQRGIGLQQGTINLEPLKETFLTHREFISSTLTQNQDLVNYINKCVSAIRASFLLKADHLKGTMSGDINTGEYRISSGIPISNSHVANKEYVDLSLSNELANYTPLMDRLKGTATGSIDMGVYTITGNMPVSDRELVNKMYLDHKLLDYTREVNKLAGVATGNIDMNKYMITQKTKASDPLHLVNKSYVDTLVTNKLVDYTRKTDKLVGVATGNIDMDKYMITQKTSPSNPLHLVNRLYVDSTINSKVSNYVELIDHLSGIATGDIDMSSHIITQKTSPNQPFHLVNKSYVDLLIRNELLNYTPTADKLIGVATGNIDMDKYVITQKMVPNKGADLTNKSYVDSLINARLANYVQLIEHLSGIATGNIDMSKYVITQKTTASNPLHVVNKSYVDTLVTNKLMDYTPIADKLAGIATSNIDMSKYMITQKTTASNPLHVVNKSYVDTLVTNKLMDYVALKDHLSGTATGHIDMNSYSIKLDSPPSESSSVVNKAYVDSTVSNKLNDYVDKTQHLKGTAMGDIDMSSYTIKLDTIPSKPSHLVNKTYVDSLVTNKIANYVELTNHLSGMATGHIDMDKYVITQKTAPDKGEHLANKDYIDKRLEEFVPKAKHLSGKASGNVNMLNFSIDTDREPSFETSLTNKKYVDTKINARLSSYLLKSETLRGKATGEIDMGKFSIRAEAPLEDKQLANKEYVDNKVIIETDKYILKKDRLKGTATGNIDMRNFSVSATEPISDKHLTNKVYVDKKITDTVGNYLLKTKHLSGVATGNIDMAMYNISSLDPTESKHLANKKYIDKGITNAISSINTSITKTLTDYVLKKNHMRGTATGHIDMASFNITSIAPTNSQHLANKKYIDDKVAATVNSINRNITKTVDEYVLKIDHIKGTATGNVDMNGFTISGIVPTIDKHLANKKYVDDKITRTIGDYLLKDDHIKGIASGNVDMNGFNITSVAPTDSGHLANKGYVDSKYTENKTYIDDKHTESKAYTDDKHTESKAYTDDKLTEAKAYIDDKQSGDKSYIDDKHTESKSYTDDKLTEAKTYTDDKHTEANTYTDDKLTENKKYIDDKHTEGKTYTDDKLTEAKTYTDDKHTEGKTYTDDKLVEANTYTDNKHTESKSYADDKLTENKKYIDDKHTEGKSYTDDKLTEANTYTDDKLTEANTYTDNKHTESKTYTDDKLTEANTYTDNKHTESKTYTDLSVSATIDTLEATITNTVSNYVLKTDHIKGTATGNVDMDIFNISSKAPTNNRHLANKRYVDTNLYKDPLARLDFTMTYYVNSLDSVTYDPITRKVSSIRSIENIKAEAPKSMQPLLGTEADRINGHLPIVFSGHEMLVTDTKTYLDNELDTETLTIVYRSSALGAESNTGLFSNDSTRFVYLTNNQGNRNIVIGGTNTGILVIGSASRLGTNSHNQLMSLDADPTAINQMICLTIQWDYVGGTNASSVFCNGVKLASFMSTNTNVDINRDIVIGMTNGFGFNGNVYYFSHKRGILMPDNEIKDIHSVLCNEFSIKASFLPINALDKYLLKMDHLSGKATGDIDMGIHSISSATPTSDKHLANKKYIDDKHSENKSFMYSKYLENRQYINDKHTKNKKYIDDRHIENKKYIDDRHTENKKYIDDRHTENKTYIDDKYMQSKQYIDNSVQSTINTLKGIESNVDDYVLKTDHIKGTATGDVDMDVFNISSKAPINNRHLANKRYVDISLYKDPLSKLGFTTTYYINSLELVTHDPTTRRIERISSIENVEAKAPRSMEPLLGTQTDEVNGHLPIVFSGHEMLLTDTKTYLGDGLDTEIITIVYKSNILGATSNLIYNGLFSNDLTRFVYFTNNQDNKNIVVGGASTGVLVISTASKFTNSDNQSLSLDSDPSAINQVICLTIQWDYVGGTNASSVFCNGVKLASFTSTNTYTNRNGRIVIGGIGSNVDSDLRFKGNVYYFSHKKGETMLDKDIKDTHCILCNEFNIKTLYTNALDKYTLKMHHLSGKATGDIEMGTYSISTNTPRTSRHLANKKYVDDKHKDSKSFMYAKYLENRQHIDNRHTKAKAYTDDKLTESKTYTDDRLTENKKYIDDKHTEGKTYTDDKLTEANTYTDNKHTEGKTYTDDKLTEANTYTDNKHTESKSYANDKLTENKKYIDDKHSEGKTYTDDKLTEAKSYSDNKLTEANTYTDNKHTESKSYADDKLTENKKYIDDKHSEGKTYTDNKLTEANTYTDDKHIESKSYADDKLTENKKYIDDKHSEGKTYTDDKLTEAKSYSDNKLTEANTYTDNKHTESKSYADDKLTENKKYIDDKHSEGKTYTDNKLTEANTYTDDKHIESKSYTDDKLTENKKYIDDKHTEGKTYTDNKLTEAKSYSDDKLTEANTYTDNKHTESKSYADDKLTENKKYIDDKHSEGKTYTDNKLTEANTYTDDKHIESKSYTDDKLTENKKYIDDKHTEGKTYTDDKLTEAKSYSDDKLTEANTYTDNKHTESKSYADDKLTENKKYIDDKHSEGKTYTDDKLTEAKSYSDNKLTEANTYTDNKHTESKSYADDKLTENKKYIDDKHSEGKTYTDNKLTEANTYTDDKHIESKSYTDDKLTENKKYIDDKHTEGKTYTDDKLTEAKSYSDDKLTEANTYTDNKHTESKSYADDKHTENKKYIDDKHSEGKTYTDNKLTEAIPIQTTNT